MADFDFARPEDFPALSVLWQQSLGQTAEDALFYLKNRYRPGELIVIRDRNGAPVSMMTLIPARLNDVPGSFLYAVGTRPDRQGEGLMHSLHQQALDYLESQGMRFVCLAPGSSALFASYAEMGYVTRFYRSERKYVNFSPCPFLDLEIPSEVEFTLMRAAYLQSTNYRLRLMCPEFLLQELRHFGGDVVSYERGDRKNYAAYTLRGDLLHIRELSEPFSADLGATLLAYTGCRQILVDSPRKSIPVGMYRPLGKDPFPRGFTGAMTLCLDQ
ncbi:MAG: GNAT family N-acetyltransferase [Firmicutes bacterium]|nr:GNAT family N-acetyltransferase [Bacillota bacterium]